MGLRNELGFCLPMGNGLTTRTRRCWSDCSVLGCQYQCSSLDNHFLARNDRHKRLRRCLAMQRKKFRSLHSSLQPSWCSLSRVLSPLAVVDQAMLDTVSTAVQGCFYDPGAFRSGFFGFCSVFVTAAFAFPATELVGLAAAESKTPQTSLPSAV